MEDSLLRLEGIYRKGYGIVPKFIMHDQALTLESKAIYAYLCALAGSGAQTFPYRDTILRHLSISKSAYYRHYTPLIDQGYITVHRPKDKTAANIYTLVSNPKRLAEAQPDADRPGMLRYRGLKAHGYGSIPRLVMTDPGLTIKAKGLYAYFCSYCGAGDCAFPRKDDILFHLGVSEPTYYKAYTQLKEQGYLVVVQRMEGSRFGVNDYFLNEEPGGRQSPYLKNEDTVTQASPSPHPKIWDTKTKDTKIGDTKNRDTLSKNSPSNNSPSNTSPSIGPPRGMDRQSITLQKARALMGQAYPEGAVTDGELTGFLAHFQANIKDKSIRNLTAYMQTSLDNWLKEQAFLQATAVPGQRASYALSDMQRWIEQGDFPDHSVGEDAVSRNQSLTK